MARRFTRYKPELPVSSRSLALRLPMRALAEEPSGNGTAATRSAPVFVVQGGVARRVAVTIGYVEGDYGEAIDGLAEGDLLVVEGQSRLRDGGTVEVVQTHEPPNTGPSTGQESSGKAEVAP